MAQGVPVYHDPYEKNNLKGNAMLIARIADTAEATHHAVTCQRWLVQFEEGQEYEAHWVDPNDFAAWEVPFIGTGIVTFNRNSFSFQDGVLYNNLRLGEVLCATGIPGPYASYIAAFPGRFRRVSFYSYCSGVNGAPGMLTFRPQVNQEVLEIIDVHDYDQIGEHNYQFGEDHLDKNFAIGDRFSAVLRCDCDPGVTLNHIRFVAHYHLQFGPNF